PVPSPLSIGRMVEIFRTSKSKEASKQKKKDKAKAYYHEELERRQNRARKKRNVLIDRLIDPGGQTTVMGGITDYQCNTAVNERQDTEFTDTIVEELRKRQKYEDSLKVQLEKKKVKTSVSSEWIRRISIFGERLANRLPMTTNLDGSEALPHNLAQLSLQSYPLTRDLPPD
ncbi:hypothetical protein PMAYCL1PPCAC_18830, partial [Pristionchus mayeri]